MLMCTLLISGWELISYNTNICGMASTPHNDRPDQLDIALVMHYTGGILYHCTINVTR